MLKLSGNLNLSTESCAVDAFGQLGREELDDNLSAQEFVGRDEHFTHPAAAELALDVVGVGKRSFEPVFVVGHFNWGNWSGPQDRARCVIEVAKFYSSARNWLF